MPVEPPKRRLFIGAEVQPGGGTHFRVWAPRRKRVEVVLTSGSPEAAGPKAESYPLAPEQNGFFAGSVEQAAAGDLYRFRLDGESPLYPDPASRFQPDGSSGPSQIVDPSRYAWRDAGWKGRALPGQVIYEMHLGTFTAEGTWAAAARELEELAEFGVTVLEVLPVAEFPGRFGWGYDGVDFYAPTRLYGSPDDFRSFVDRAHGLGLAVILDVVYNHFGPADNYLGQFSDDFVSRRHHTEWGDAVNFDGENSGPVREFFIANAGYWIDEFHLDGLRLDAIHAIVDDSEDHVLGALTRRVREKAAGRPTIVVAENEHQQAIVVRGVEQGGYGVDASWNDDFHHAARVAMTGHRDFFYADYRGTPQELISAVKRGFLYQGQWNARQAKRRGSSTRDLSPWQFVTFLENHDQLSHSGRGQRPVCLTSPGRYRALTALWLLGPGTPMFFQGQEFRASAPFAYFADHRDDLAELVRKGRLEFMRNFRCPLGDEGASDLCDPSSIETFQRCKLDFAERARHGEAYRMHRELLKLRREDSVFAAQCADRIEGAVLADEAFVLRYFGNSPGDDRLLLVNLGVDVPLSPLSEPLLAPPGGGDWKPIWSSEDVRYGGAGTSALDAKNWLAPAHAALVLTAAPSRA
ncbi:MAG TPA: malto-oligosyltrehalose trehalohydrolase [Pirellulales bacterium]|nr:malto-oligosyltrehalose trehalohydrolase [Pirellulales bacterium]